MQVKQLVEKYGDVLLQPYKNWSALYQAAVSVKSLSNLNNKLDIIKYLIEQKPESLNFKDNTGCSALFELVKNISTSPFITIPSYKFSEFFADQSINAGSIRQKILDLVKYSKFSGVEEGIDTVPSWTNSLSDLIYASENQDLINLFKVDTTGNVPSDFSI